MAKLLKNPVVEQSSDCEMSSHVPLLKLRILKRYWRSAVAERAECLRIHENCIHPRVRLHVFEGEVKVGAGTYGTRHIEVECVTR
jgi:hypothetical protein